MKSTKHFLFGLKGFFICSLLINFLFTQNNTITLSGRVTDTETGKPISGANVVCGDIGTTTDNDGAFSLVVLRGDGITVSVIGYRTLTFVPTEKYLIIRLTLKVLKGREVLVLANRAVAGVTPVAFSTLTSDEIQARYTVEDVPMILSLEPGVYAYSESGNGTGYSYVSIRGFDQSRIAVMLDNVPLNDNESHQVYWVDHGDILSDAQDVQIQRGIGNSLYGSSAFGGSINVRTKIADDHPELSFNVGTGSYNTRKFRVKYNSGLTLGNNLSLSVRTSQINSDGYRDHHGSLQRAFSFGLEHRGVKVTNQIRGLIGYENTELAWDGVYGDAINDREDRRKGYKGFTDDFLQQIYSLNSQLRLSKNSFFNNTAYLVMGRGYYEAKKSDKSFYEYNLDTFFDATYADSTTDLLRRKWIVNKYFGVIPQWTVKKDRYRFDLGGEIRLYHGNHFGKVSKFSSPLLWSVDKFKYYQYLGKKTSLTFFTHIVYDLTEQLLLSIDLQFLRHDWNMDQEKIGHAKGHQISADWKFFNPRLGFTYRLSEELSVFCGFGKAEKEPSDDQIINADEWMFEPQGAYPELIYDAEIGLNYIGTNHYFNLNLYRINLENEVMETISFEEEGYYEYSQADKTDHQGIEVEVGMEVNKSFSITMNGAISKNFHSSGVLDDNLLPNQPTMLANLIVKYSPISDLDLYAHSRLVGKSYIDPANIEENAINSHTLIDLGIFYNWDFLSLSAKINNVMDTLYITHGEDWGSGWIAYWPGATRNFFVTLTVQL